MGILSRFGIGNAVVDLRLPEDVEQGETVAATVHAEGGDDPQEVEAVYAKIEAEYPGGGDEPDPSHEMAKQHLVDESFTIEPGETYDMDVELHIPHAAPITRPQEELDWPGRRRAVYPTAEVETGMDVSLAVDPSDEDPIAIDVGGRFETFHHAVVDHLGFKLQEIDHDLLPGMNNHTQVFEYIPTSGSRYSGELEDIEATLDYGHDGPGLGLRMEVEARGESLLGRDEEHTTFVVDADDPERVAADVRELID